MTPIETVQTCLPGVRVERDTPDEHGEVITIDMNISIYRFPMKRRRIGGEMDWLGYQVVVVDHEGNEALSTDHFTLQEAIIAAGIEYYRQRIVRKLDDISTDEYAKELAVEAAQTPDANV